MHKNSTNYSKLKYLVKCEEPSWLSRRQSLEHELHFQSSCSLWWATLWFSFILYLKRPYLVDLSSFQALPQVGLLKWFQGLQTWDDLRMRLLLNKNLKICTLCYIKKINMLSNGCDHIFPKWHKHSRVDQKWWTKVPFKSP